jgi:NAD(P)H-nitrite reductase large subunit
MSENSTPRGAILQRDKKTYAIVPRMPVGVVSLENLEDIVKAVKKYNIPIIKITSGQRLALVGVEKGDIDGVWQDLKMDVGKATELCLHYVQACPGNDFCKYGVRDSLGLGREIEEFFLGMALPAKVKIGVSGCPFSCAESYVRDIGMFGKKSGWTFIFGGSSSRRPRIGDVIAEDLTRQEIIALAKRCLEFYAAQGNKKERVARFVERMGIDAVKKAVL